MTITVHHSKITSKSTLRRAALTDVETGEIEEMPGELFRAATYEFLVKG